MQRYRVVIMLVLFGVLPVVAAFFVALSFLGEEEPEPAQVEVAPVVEEPPPEPESPPAQEVLVAARALPVGTLLEEDNLTRGSLDSDDVGAEHFVAVDDTSAQALRGHVVREPIAAGAPLTRSAVLGPRQKGFLAAVLKPGSRAVTIRVGPATSHAGLIDPGDRVDVILSAEVALDGGDRSAFARTVVEDVRVVAIDRRPGPGAEPTERGEDAERTEMVTATLEASPEQGDRLVLGDHEGKLSLAVRSLAAAEDPTDTVPSAVDLREMLLSTAEFSASETRMKRALDLGDLAARRQIVEEKEQLRAAIDGSADRRQAVRIFRGTEPAEEVVFKRR